MNEEVFRAVADALDRGEAVALVTIVDSQGSTPQRVGARMLVYPDGRTVGTIGGGCYENDAIGKARAALTTRRPVLARYELNDDVAAETGLICGGQMEVFIEPVEGAPHLYIAGAGHVAQCLGRFAAETGFRVHVVDDREKFANPERFPFAVEVAAAPIPDWLRDAPLPAGAYVVIVTRGHRYDLDALTALAGRDLRYVGMIGSRAKVARIREALEQHASSGPWLERVHAPIGLDIGAVTPAEIAVSILAEMIAVRYARIADPRIAAVTMRWRP
jgi:xanthine dehydrogenase accessory factor